MAPPPGPSGAAEPISLREAAQRLGVHYMTAYRYVRIGRLPARRSGQEWLIDPADLALVHPAKPLESDGPLRPDRRDRVPLLRARMVAGDEAGAWRIVEDALASGQEAAGIYLDLLVPVLRSVGDGWAGGTVSVAAEHRASAVAQRIIGRLGPQFARRGRKRGTVIIGGPAGDQHSLPGAIVADLLRGAGFDVIDLGGNTPAESFAETAQQATRLVAVVVGVTAPGLDDTVRATLAALHGEALHGEAPHGDALGGDALGGDALDGGALSVPVLVGGSAIGGPEHARELGADAWTGTDGRSVVAAVARLAGPAPRQ